MICIIAGSRDVQDFRVVEQAFNAASLQLPAVTEIVSGTARGVDRLGEQLTGVKNIPVQRFPADWDKYGKGAGHIRNKQMADYADVLIAIWDGKSKGTDNMIKTMLKLNKPVWVWFTS